MFFLPIALPVHGQLSKLTKGTGQEENIKNETEKYQADKRLKGSHVLATNCRTSPRTAMNNKIRK
jgi:hypothetical protein